MYDLDPNTPDAPPAHPFIDAALWGADVEQAAHLLRSLSLRACPCGAAKCRHRASAAAALAVLAPAIILAADVRREAAKMDPADVPF